ncbi:MAG TPA: tyrosine-type recombinase/integrase [Rhizomicrobium sp.]|jgi:integrase|nr:tyrosine-type recombinase/integrase [Rhizomicrobium sp.]
MIAKRKVALTDRYLKAIKPAPKRKRPIVWDAVQPHLGVRVTDKGHLTFVVVRRRPGDKQPIRHILGAYPSTTLAAARAATPDILAALTQGKRPAELEAERLREAARKRRDTFGVVAEEFIKRHVSKLRSARATELLIRRELLGQSLRRRKEDGKWIDEWVASRDQRWYGRPITEITRRDAVELLETIADHGSRHQARKTFAAASKLFNWALWRDTYGLDGSPFARLKSTDLFGKFAPRSRVLTDDELRLIWRAAGELGPAEDKNGKKLPEHLRAYPFGTMVRALALTGQRLREISDAQWSEIALDKALLTVPDERMKGKVSHTVPLTPIVITLLQGAPRFEGGAFVFTTTAGKRPISGFSKMKSRLDREIAKRADGTQMAPWTLHDLRRTMRTRLSGLGVLPLVAELIIGHKQGGIQAVYDLHTYDAEKRAALAKWEDALAAIVGLRPAPDGASVVPAEEVERRRKKRKRA